jgi:hypothetical protein
MKTSSSIGLAAAKAATSSIDSSRGATMRVTPRRAATAAAAGADSVIWVDAWSVERRAQRAREQRHRGVLDDQRVDPGGGRGPHDPLDRGQLGLEHQRVERQVAARAGAVDLPHHRRQIVDAKVVGAGARVPALVDAEVHRVGARGERGGQRRGAAGSGARIAASRWRILPRVARISQGRGRRSAIACNEVDLHRGSYLRAGRHLPITPPRNVLP